MIDLLLSRLGTAGIVGAIALLVGMHIGRITRLGPMWDERRDDWIDTPHPVECDPDQERLLFNEMTFDTRLAEEIGLLDPQHATWIEQEQPRD